MLTENQILNYDAKHNYPPGVKPTELLDAIKEKLDQGWQIVRENNTLIIFSKHPDGSCEFYTFNADPIAVMAKNVVAFWDMLKKLNVASAFTTYTNPEISAVFRSKVAPYRTKVGKQPDGEFKATVEL
jgi:hypothetical protein